MKKLASILFPVVLLTFSAAAQSTAPEVDKSPMDMSYYPSNYPLLKVQGKTNEALIARVIYGRPMKNGRVIFGNLLEYGKIWRLGANEATEIEFFNNVKIGTTPVKKGRYTLYAIPDSARWTFVLNRDMYVWGSFIYNEKKDVLRISVPVQPQAEIIETFSLFFEKAAKGFTLNAVWDNIKVALPISL
ncbi:MAG: DUF2911 domain-containing protein [Ferruginibacter sp.]